MEVEMGRRNDNERESDLWRAFVTQSYEVLVVEIYYTTLVLRNWLSPSTSLRRLTGFIALV